MTLVHTSPSTFRERSVSRAFRRQTDRQTLRSWPSYRNSTMKGKIKTENCELKKFVSTNLDNVERLHVYMLKKVLRYKELTDKILKSKKVKKN